MNNSNKMFVESVLTSNLCYVFPDGFERENVINAIFEDVVSDIEETADEAFNSDDVLIAMGRVIYKKIVE